MNTSTNKEFDLVVFGATSFVGKILCQYLVNEHVEPNLTWAMAARSESKLSDLKKSLGVKAAEIPHLVADSADEKSLRMLCEKASVIISTVGPYSLYGDKLVKCCALSGTDYCDLTGEAHWIKRMISRYESLAENSGARIVHSCGFDSIPSDLGVKFLQDAAYEQFGEYCSVVKMRVKKLKGGASGGTIASGINMYKEASRDKELQEELKDIYSICPEDFGVKAVQHSVDVEFDDQYQAWAAPFIMAAINTRVVLRSNAIRADGPYATGFKYDEAMLTGANEEGKKQAKRAAFGTKLAPSMMSFWPVRSFLESFVLPKPGQGPTPKQQEEGCYDLRFYGTTESGKEIKTKLTGDRDPGYGSTAKMLAQAAISLHRDVDRNSVKGGFWTPATVFNDQLIDRLQQHAGMTFELDS